MVLVPLIKHFQALNEECVPDTEIHFFDSIVWALPWVLIDCRARIKLLLTSACLQFPIHLVSLLLNESSLVDGESVWVLLFQLLILKQNVLLVVLNETVVEWLRKLPLVLPWLVLFIIHVLILTFLFGIVDNEVAELLINFLPHVMLCIRDHASRFCRLSHVPS